MKKNTGFSKTLNLPAIFIGFLFFAVLIFESSLYAQKRKLIYDVVKNGNIIGKIILIELKKDQKLFLSLVSDVKTRFVFSFSDHAVEEATFEDGVMKYSSFYQKQNGSEEANKKTIAFGDFYKMINGNRSKLLSFNQIRYNMLLLYTNIPENIDKVYSDNFQKLLEIKKVADNKYKLILPDGNHNYYHYKNSICTKVEIDRTFFNVQFVLKEIINEN